MFRKKSYRFGRWRDWDHTLDAAAKDFLSRFLLEPRIMLADSSTYASIDLAASKRNVHEGGVAGRNPEEGEYAPITEFAAEGYHLSFCVEERLPKGAFALVYDSGPQDGEPVPDDEGADEVELELAQHERESA